MATAPERLRPLHTFPLPRLRWGNQRLFRCMKVNADGDFPSDRRLSPSEAESDGCNRITEGNSVIKRRSPNIPENFLKSALKPIDGDIVRTPRKDGEDNGIGIEAVREKLMFDFRLAADKMKVSIEKDFELPTSARPWNLRTRRAACKEPNNSAATGGSAKGAILRGEEPRSSNGKPSPVIAESPMSKAKSSRMGGLAAAARTAQCLEKREQLERPRFSISLSQEEIVSDFLAMTGTKPKRRPTKKRPKIVQKNLDSVFPGLWLTEVTLDQYKVPDFQEPRKRGRIEEQMGSGKFKLLFEC
ncbi:uncharacterized protein LOC132285635 [Cornus florida]|uniref:uncharacterized protein LOC132285635 n=1 Tax=Cornus florida TaxID=4283 RepID=UPI00289D3ECE|nr:uncharacterized protein LOC132285635 [Cornus florida]XP_059643814.1 uncharacterized protein LOC132285635 [Cornus florida]